MPCDYGCEKCEDSCNKLYNLLARIHGDGGHYTGTHGLDKSVADADLLVAWYSEDKKALLAKINILQEALKRIAACRGTITADVVKVASTALLAVEK